MKKKDEENGVWRTVGGRRIFIKEGEDLKSAMDRSGKFKGLTKEGMKVVAENGEEFRKAKKETDELIKQQEQKLKKQRLEKQLKDAENKWLEDYNNSNWNDENWKKENDRLQKERDNAKKEYDDFFKDYIKTANENELTWQDKVRRNDIEMENRLNDLQSRRNDFEYKYHPDKWSDDYYGTFREYEKKNAKLKEDIDPDELYEPIASWGTFNEKRKFLSGDTINEDGSTNFGDNKWSGREYTNDEFMEHLEDANWHTERRMLETAGLTNQQLEYIKDKTTLDSYGVGKELTGRENVQKMINEAKTKFPQGSGKTYNFSERRLKETAEKIEYANEMKQYKAQRKEEKIQNAIGTHIDNMFNIMEQNGISFDDMLEYLKKKNK